VDCQECGGPVPASRIRPQGHPVRYCSDTCRRRCHRRRRPEVKARKNAVRQRRYATDPTYRDETKRKVRERKQIATYGFVLNTPEDIIANAKDRFKVARALGFRSGLEVAIARQIEKAGLPVLYEAQKVYYVWPATPSYYSPDFVLPNGVVIETKGRFLTEDRQKSKHIKSQHPDLDLRFVFSNANARLTKVSKTTYAAWSEKYGFKWASKVIPEEWLREPACQRRLKALRLATSKPQ
jgi:hypothetical protein